MSKPVFQTQEGELFPDSTVKSRSKLSLEARVAIRLATGLFFALVALFATAGTFRFWQAWVFLALVYGPAAYLCIHLLLRNRQVIERRLNARERSPRQRHLMRLAKPIFLLVFLLPGLDHRFGWSQTLLEKDPLWLTLVAQVMVLTGVLLIGWTIDMNHFSSRTIHTESGQKLVSSGPYGVVRHPLYAGSLIVWLCTPIALGSFAALPAFALLIPFYVARVLNEEKTLHKHLAGYAAYCRSTPFRLAPFIW